MRKQILSVLLALCIMGGTAMAQGGGQPRQTPEERLAATLEKLTVLNLSAEQQEKSKTIFTEFFAAQQKTMDEMRASGTMDRDAMMAKRKELSDARDAKLKGIFTAEQMKKWVDEVEPSLRQRRQPPAGK